MLSAATALLLAATPSAPTLWLELDVDATSPCNAEGIATSIRGLRPDLALNSGRRPVESDLQVLLIERNGSLSLTIVGRGKPLTRDLPPADGSCAEASQTAALIIDRYLDEFYEGETEASSASSGAGTRASLALELGPSLVQMPSGLSPNPSPGLILQLNLRLGLILLSLGGEANLAGGENIGSGSEGSYRVQPAATWVAAGIAPRLGPGRLELQASFGLGLLWVQIQTSLHQPEPGNAVNPYAGLVAAYFIDLPSHFSLGLQFEERFIPAPSEFAVEGVSGTASVVARHFTADLALLLGYTFF
jgi:hypothetical protein